MIPFQLDDHRFSRPHLIYSSLWIILYLSSFILSVYYFHYVYDEKNNPIICFVGKKCELILSLVINMRYLSGHITHIYVGFQLFLINVIWAYVRHKIVLGFLLKKIVTIDESLSEIIGKDIRHNKNGYQILAVSLLFIIILFITVYDIIIYIP